MGLIGDSKKFMEYKRKKKHSQTATSIKTKLTKKEKIFEFKENENFKVI